MKNFTRARIYFLIQESQTSAAIVFYNQQKYPSKSDCGIKTCSGEPKERKPVLKEILKEVPKEKDTRQCTQLKNWKTMEM